MGERQSILNEYNPFQIVHFKHSFKINQRINIARDFISITAETMIVRSHNKEEDTICCYSREGELSTQFTVSSYSTPLLAISTNYFGTYDISTKTMIIASVHAQQPLKFPITSPELWKHSEFQLEYFSEINELCLIQKNKEQHKLRISLYSFVEQAQIKLIEKSSYETLQDEWRSDQQIYLLTQTGKLAWCNIRKANINIKIYSQDKALQSFTVSLASLGQAFSAYQFQPQLVWQHHQTCYLLITPLNQSIQVQDNYSPILALILEESTPSVQFSTCKIHQKHMFQLNNCTNLKDYCIFRSRKSQDQTLIYDKQLDLIVLEDQSQKQNKLTNLCYPEMNEIIESRILQNQIEVQEKIIIRKSSLAYTQLLNCLYRSHQLCKDKENAVIIFGSQKSGKSTFRHFLAGGKLDHRYNEELGYQEMTYQSTEEERFEHQPQKRNAIWMSQTENAVIFDIPYLNNQQGYYKFQMTMLFTKVFRLFKNVQFLMLIPTEYIQQSQQNVQILKQIVQTISRYQKQNLDHYFSIVLTKIEEKEASIEAFRERIQQIQQEIDQQSAHFLQSIDKQGKIYAFQSRQINEGQGNAMLQQILSTDKLSLQQNEILQLQSEFKEQNSKTIKFTFESQYFIKVFNDFLRYICLRVAKNNTQLYERYMMICIIGKTIETLPQYLFQNILEVTLSCVSIFIKLNHFYERSDNKTTENISSIKQELNRLGNNLSFKNENVFLQEIVPCLIVVLQNSITFWEKQTNIGLKILLDQKEGILGSQTKEIFKRIVQSLPQIQTSNQFKQLYPDFKSSGSRVIKKYVQMTYEQERASILSKKTNMLETICSLPSNVLKLDLIMSELQKLMKKKSLEQKEKKSLEQKDNKQLKFYLKQCSTICLYHQLYYESIVFLLVIPDFHHIDLLIDELIKSIERQRIYKTKNLLTQKQQKLINELHTIARDCLRDKLSQKLVYVLSLDQETFKKSSVLRQNERQNLRDYCSNTERIKNYKSRLQKPEIKIFYNLQNDLFKNMISKDKKQLIESCKKLENSQPTKNIYERKQSIRYVLDFMQIPK